MGIFDLFFTKPEPTPCDNLNVKKDTNGLTVSTPYDKNSPNVEDHDPNLLRINVKQDGQTSMVAFDRTASKEQPGGEISTYRDENGIIERINTWASAGLTDAKQIELTGHKTGEALLAGGGIGSPVSSGTIVESVFRPSIFSEVPIINQPAALDLIKQTNDVIARHPRLAEVQSCMDYTISNSSSPEKYPDHRQHLDAVNSIVDRSR